MKKRLLISAKYMLAVSVILLGQAAFCVPADAVTRSEVGVATSASLLRMSDKTLESRLSDIKNLGATWIRVDFSWAVIQPDNAHTFHWSMFDRVVKAASAHHLKILAVLDYTPKWAAQASCVALVKVDVIKCNPRNNAEFAHFAAVAAFRYRNQSVRAWEIWNEPNLTAYWKTVQADHTATVDPKAYARMANAAAEQIRYHDKDSIIMSGGLSPMFEPKKAVGMSQSDFLTQLLPHLNKRFFDAIAMHPYSWPALPSKAASYNAFYTIDQGKPSYNLRAIMQKAGWGSKQIWATEFGASTVGKRLTTTPTSRPDHVTETSQAQIIKLGVNDWFKKQNVGPLFVHSDSDQWLIARKNEGGFGLRRNDGSKKPAYDAFKVASQAIKK